MNGAWDEVKQALAAARAADYAIKQHANDMAELLAGNLNKVRGSHLAKLKRELRDFNIQTRRWKS